MDNKELNLCELLKDCGSAVFYCPVWGDTNVVQIYPDDIRIAPTSNLKAYLNINGQGKADDNGEVILFPSRDQRDWAKWAEENKKVTYSDVVHKIGTDWKAHIDVTSEAAGKKLFAIAKLMNVQKYLEKGWQPYWRNCDTPKYYLSINKGTIEVLPVYGKQSNEIYFSTEANALRAIDILGEETIRLALSTDW